MDFATILAKEDEPVVIIDKESTILRINPLFTTEYGWTEDDLVGKPLTAIIPEEMRDAHHMGISRVMTTGESSLANQFLDLEVLYKDGSKAVAPHFITMGEIDGQTAFAAVIQPPK